MSPQHRIRSQGLPPLAPSSTKRRARTPTPSTMYPCRMESCCNNKLFLKKFNHKIHELTKAALREYQCDICVERFPQLSNLIRHKRSLHHIACKYCGEVFTNKWDIPAHCAAVHPDREPVQRTVRNFKTACNHGLCFPTCEERNRHENACEEIKMSRRLIGELYDTINVADLVDGDEGEHDDDMSDDDDHPGVDRAPAAPIASPAKILDSFAEVHTASPPNLDQQAMSSVSTDSDEGPPRVYRMGSSQDGTRVLLARLAIMHETTPQTDRMSSNPSDGFEIYTPRSGSGDVLSMPPAPRSAAVVQGAWSDYDTRDALSSPPPAPRSAAVAQAAWSDYDTDMYSVVVDTMDMDIDPAMRSAITAESFHVSMPVFRRQNTSCASQVAPLFNRSSLSPPMALC